MSTVDQQLQELIVKSSQLMMDSETESAIQLLQSEYANFSTNSLYLQTLGEAYLENSQVEEAYKALTASAELDAEARESVEKFLYLGQIIGGEDGVKYLSIGVEKLLEFHELVNTKEISQLSDSNEVDTALKLLLIAYNTKENILAYILKKLNQGIFGIIEIWMTDLCMEEQAESECEKLITLSLNLDSSNPETWSLLASIRISQTRNDDAKEAILKSWDLFNAKKIRLEELADSNNQENENIDLGEVNMEYIELVQPLLTLSKYAIELGLFEKSIVISSAVQDINEQNLESFYLDGFANYLIAKRIQNNIPEDQAYMISQNFTELALNIKVDPSDESSGYIQEAREALSQAYKLSQVDDIAQEADPELLKTVEELMNSVGGFLLKSKRNQDITDENWEEQIAMDDDE